MTRALIQVALAGVVVCSTAVVSLAQQPTTTTATETKTFEILSVDGNQLVVRLPEGTRELTVADDFRFNIGGKQMSVRELKPGMKGSASITTKTTVTPVTVTEVKSGQIMQTSGSSIIVRTPEGIKMFTQSDVDKRGVKIMRDGKPAQITDFRTGDQLTATIITSKPPRVMTEKEVNATLASAGGGGAPAATKPGAGGASAAAKPGAGGASGAPPAATAGAAASAAPARALPKTASSWPLVGLASILALATGLGLTIRRRFVG